MGRNYERSGFGRTVGTTLLQHCRDEFEKRDVNATMATMVNRGGRCSEGRTLGVTCGNQNRKLRRQPPIAGDWAMTDELLTSITPVDIRFLVGCNP